MKNKSTDKNITAFREHKAFKFNLESVGDEGEFSGYAAVFDNVDDSGDVIEKGAFAKTISEDFERIKILSQHQDCELPIGKPLELREDEKGLFVRAKISDTQKGRDIRTLLKDGVLNELSIGYDAVDAYYDNVTRTRHLKELRLWEISIVTWAMNELAQIEEVKSFAEKFQFEVKSGRFNRTKLASLKLIIAAIKALIDILSPFLEMSKQTEEPLPADLHTQDDKTKSAKQTKKANIIFTITK